MMIIDDKKLCPHRISLFFVAWSRQLMNRTNAKLSKLDTPEKKIINDNQNEVMSIQGNAFEKIVCKLFGHLRILILKYM